MGKIARLRAHKPWIIVHHRQAAEPTAQNSRKRQADGGALPGIRGLAILLVLIFHYVVNSVRTEPGSIGSYALGPLGVTWTGAEGHVVLLAWRADYPFDVRTRPLPS